MKDPLLITICLLLAAALAGGHIPAFRVYASTNTKEQDGEYEPGLSRLNSLPPFEWQKTACFPDWKNYTDDTLAMNGMLSFRFYHGQGMLYLDVAEDTEGFRLYVNGKKYDTSGVSGGIWGADLSGSAIDGINTLQISGISLSQKESVTVYIPYPEVLPEEVRPEGDVPSDPAPGAGDSSLGGPEGIHRLSLKLIGDLIQSDIDYGFTSAQLAVVRNGRLVYENAWGRLNSYEPDGSRKEDGPSADTQTLYDLASLTKMFAANYAIQKLVEDGLLDVDTPVVQILGSSFASETLDLTYAGAENQPDPDAQKAWKEALTVRDLLTHQAGFPACPAYNDPDFDLSAMAPGAPGSNLCYAQSRDQVPGAIFKTPLLYEPRTRTVYSDIDYMLACFMIEKITGLGLDEYMNTTFFEPMGLDHITFRPLDHGFVPEDCAATELYGNTRGRHVSFRGIRTETIQGQVHDERAFYCMDGVSGHAGLFSNASDLAKLASVMLTGGYGGHHFFSRNVIECFTAPKSFELGQWGLGWWREGEDQRPWYFGTQADSATIGHQGWTGTLGMIDPSRELVVIYLTNKINSPLVSDEDLNQFAGNCYTASTLGFVPQILSIGMDSDLDISGQLLALLADMAEGSFKLIPADAEEEHPYRKNTMSKIAVLRTWAEELGDEEMTAFAQSLAKRLEGGTEDTGDSGFVL